MSNCNNLLNIFDNNILKTVLNGDYNSFVIELRQKIECTLDIRIVTCKSIDKNITQNSNFIINDGLKNYFVKVYVSGFAEERIFEAKVLEKLRDEGCLFVIKLITETPLIVNGIPVMIFEAINGIKYSYQQFSSKELKSIATKIAQMHNTLRFFNPGEKNRFPLLGFDFISEFNLTMKDHLIIKGIQLLKELYGKVNIKQLVPTIIHDDFSPHNIMKTKDGIINFIDFDDAHSSYRISDIGTAIKEFLIHPMMKVDDKSIAIFIKNYESVKGTPKITKQERQLIMPMVLRRALFMYAYYKKLEGERGFMTQSNDEYRVISKILEGNVQSYE